jgi:hypothetical protein
VRRDGQGVVGEHGADLDARNAARDWGKNAQRESDDEQEQAASRA